MSHQDQSWAVDDALVGRLLAEQFPSWASLALSRAKSAGTDNAIFRLGSDLAVRLPLRESAGSQAEREQRWLPKLAPALPLEIPVPVGAGAPGEGYPWAWSVCRWLDGQDAATAAPASLTEAARGLGRFLVALRAVDVTGGPVAGRSNSGRGVPLAMLDSRVRRDVESLAQEIPAAEVLKVWEEALAAPVYCGAAWVHGDLHPGNLLVRDGRLVAVLDFGLMGVGDPACDLFVAWSYLDGAARREFRVISEADEAMWLRGRGWAVFSAVIALAFYRDTNPLLSAMSRRTLAQLVS